MIMAKKHDVCIWIFIQTAGFQDEERIRNDRTSDVEEQILQRVEDDLGTLVRRITLMENVSTQTASLMLHVQLLYPYHVQRVQALHLVDFLPKPNFWICFLAKIGKNSRFSTNIFATEETVLTK